MANSGGPQELSGANKEKLLLEAASSINEIRLALYKMGITK